MEGKGTSPVERGQLRGLLSVLQWWGFNVLVIIMNKWIFQVGFSTCPPLWDSDNVLLLFIIQRLKVFERI